MSCCSRVWACKAAERPAMQEEDTKEKEEEEDREWRMMRGRTNQRRGWTWRCASPLLRQRSAVKPRMSQVERNLEEMRDLKDLRGLIAKERGRVSRKSSSCGPFTTTR